MYAALVSVIIDEGKNDEARTLLEQQIVPMVKSSEGFVAGYWFEPQGSSGWSVVVFDTEEHARAAIPPAGSRPPGAPVTIDGVDVREVIASA